MTNAKATEYRIIRTLLSRPSQSADFTPGPGLRKVLERASAIVAATAAVFVLGSYLQELLWALIAAATMFMLGASEG